jgi:hypothetical protein
MSQMKIISFINKRGLMVKWAIITSIFVIIILGVMLLYHFKDTNHTQKQSRVQDNYIVIPDYNNYVNTLNFSNTQIPSTTGIDINKLLTTGNNNIFFGYDALYNVTADGSVAFLAGKCNNNTHSKLEHSVIKEERRIK